MIRFNYMGLEFQQHPQGVDVFATGELQFYDSQKFMKTVPEETKGKGRNVTLDMGELKFIDSAGLGAVLYVSEALRMQGQKLILRNVNQYNRRVLEKIAPVGTFDIQD
jgi:stage II sporulation protein AA (anti-sigma F factor antagonist)